MDASMKKRRLILHFDLNKTIVPTDVAGGKTLEGLLNGVLAEAAFGTGNFETGEWKEKFLAYPSPVGMDAEQRLDGVLATKAQRAALLSSFTEKGQPGERYQADYERLLGTLRREEEVEDQGAKYHYIVPSFFHTLRTLYEQGRDFAVVIRTFGHDIPQVVEEYNSFWNGKNSAVPGFHVPQSEIDNRLLHDPTDLGRFFRTGSTSEDTTMIMGTISEISMTDGVESLQSRSDVHITRGFRNIYVELNERLKVKKSLGLGDHYAYWASEHESASAGKLFLLDPADDETHQIFFDDNLGFERFKETGHLIVDIRNARETLDACQYENVYLVEASIFHAIYDKNYFLKCIEQCERNLDALRSAAPTRSTS